MKIKHETDANQKHNIHGAKSSKRAKKTIVASQIPLCGAENNNIIQMRGRIARKRRTNRNQERERRDNYRSIIVYI